MSIMCKLPTLRHWELVDARTTTMAPVALRDMIQSHLLQLLTLVAMEPPVSMEAESLRDEKGKVLKSIRPIAPAEMDTHAFRAQYTSGEVDGRPVGAYVDEDNVPAGTNTETYAALKLYIDNWRWRGVPFYLQTGKRLKQSQSLISICFKPPPLQFFKDTQVQQMLPNWVLLGIQPVDCLRMEVTVKEPGLEMKTRLTSLDAGFRNEDELATDAYEDLLLDVIEGDRSLFLRLDEVENAWRVTGSGTLTEGAVTAASDPSAVVARDAQRTGTQQNIVAVQTHVGLALNDNGTGAASVSNGFLLQIGQADESTNSQSAGDGFDFPIGVWGVYQHSDSEDTFAATAFDSNRDGVLAGVDFSPWDNFLAGAAVGFANVDVNTTFNGGNQDVQEISIIPYLGARLSEQLGRIRC